MVPFEELVRALERYKRRQAGLSPAEDEPRDQRAYGPGDQSSEIALEEVEDE